MKNLPINNFKKKTNILFRYNTLTPAEHSEANTGETDPTNTTITVLTTVSGQVHFSRIQNMLGDKLQV